MLTNTVIKMTFGDLRAQQISAVIIHQTHYEKSDWSRAFNQFTTACELGMINAISPADIAYIMSSSTSARLLSPSRSVLLRNKMAERFASVSEDELCEKCTIKQLLNSVFAWYHELSKPRSVLSQITQTRGFDNSWHHAKTEFNNCFIIHFSHNSSSETEAKRSAILFLRKNTPRGLVTRQTLNLTW